MIKLVLLLSILLSLDSIGKEFNFNQTMGGAASWGSGSFEVVADGALDTGSVMMRTDFGEEQSLYFEFTNLKPGIYLFESMLKGFNIQKGKYYSFWMFYDQGQGIKSVFENETGSFNWSKLQKSFKVTNKFKIWFRLKSPGVLWVDNVKLQRTSRDKSISFKKVKYTESNRIRNNIKKKPQAKKSKNIFDSDYSSKVGDYINFNSSLLEDYDFTRFDRIGFSAFNPTSSNYLLYFTIQDENTNGYWTQVNFKSLLKPGANSFEFDLNRYQGERGSSKNYKSIDLKNLKKMFIVVDPDEEGPKTNKSFVFNKFRVFPEIYPKAPAFLKIFNFSKLRDREIANYTNVTTHNLYNQEEGFGFIDPDFSSVDDSQYTPKTDRATIGITGGSFRVDTPNGFYSVWINIEKLGYWDVPFWKKRILTVNGQTLTNENRVNFRSFLNDYFRFEFVSFKEGIDPYELYMSSIMKFYKTKVQVKQKRIVFNFNADKTGINLNSLMIFPISKNEESMIFIDELQSAKELDYSKIASQIGEEAKLKKVKVSVLGKSLGLGDEEDLGPIELTATQNEKDFSVIKISNGNDEKKIKISFKDAKYFEIFEIKKQLSSMTMNHESFQLAPKIIDSKITSKNLAPNETLFLLVRNIPKATGKGELLKTTMNITGNGFKWSKEISLRYYPIKLKKPDFPVGFIGLDPFPKIYFDDPKVKNFTHQLRMKALKEISDRGFTTFSGLPGFEDKDHLSEVLSFASKNQMQSLFTYMGEFKVRSKDNYDAYKIYKKKYGINIYQSFSDEAHGYSNKVDEDIEKANSLTSKFPKLLLSGFGEGSKSLYKLNKFFDMGFYSSIERSQIKKLKGKWGAYNGSVKPTDNPEYTFGFWLYKARKAGLSAYLDWHMSAIQNYPYFELDGRETDVLMIYPKSNGEVATSLKFEIATRGLYTFRKLIHLERSTSPKVRAFLNKITSHKLNKLDPRTKISPKSLYLLNKKLHAMLLLTK